MCEHLFLDEQHDLDIMEACQQAVADGKLGVNEFERMTLNEMEEWLSEHESEVLQ